ncbi:uncharacterized protein LOC113291209 [Papaver somniferum]|uniref:uncharacterized protein LOC113291209 n=1 Tax=Papaver somniferum TaxID=3469 RepID=UPI000E6FAB24|nr:uncharacterized protein LOC113291209 [Papaver somniferum]
MGVEDLKWLGFSGVCIEACRIVFSGKRLFTKITFALILPLCLISLMNKEISEVIAHNIQVSQVLLRMLDLSNPLHAKLADLIFSKQTAVWIFGVAYSLFVYMISLLATSAVVYASSHIYISKGHIDDEISFINVMFVIPKVRGRLIITFLWNLLFVTCFTIWILLVLVLGLALLHYIQGHATTSKDEPVGLHYTLLDAFFGEVMLIIYWIGYMYIIAIWNLASVVTILEDAYGIKAMKKAKDLIKGKRWVSFITVLLIYSFLEYFNVMLWDIVKTKYDPASFTTGVVAKLIIVTVCLLLQLIGILVGLVVQSVLYFVCKSYHSETIDKASLECRLKAYREEYVHHERNTKTSQYLQVEIP